MTIKNLDAYIYHILGYDSLAAAITHIKESIINKVDPDDVKLIFISNYIPPVYDGSVDTPDTNNILKLVDILKLYCNKYGYLNIKQYYVNNKYAWILASKVWNDLNKSCISCTVLNTVYKYCYAMEELDNHNRPTIVNMDKYTDGSICGPNIQSERMRIEKCVHTAIQPLVKDGIINVINVQVSDTLSVLEGLYHEYGISIEKDVLEPRCIYCGLGDRDIEESASTLRSAINKRIGAMIDICQIGVLL